MKQVFVILQWYLHYVNRAITYHATEKTNSELDRYTVSKSGRI